MLIIPGDKEKVKKIPSETTQAIVKTPTLTPQQIESNKHDKWVEEQFKGGTGGRAKLIMMVKENLNDPSSFKHVSNTRSFEGKDLIITMKYRAENGFGAKILLEVRAKIYYVDDTVEIIE